MTYCLTGCGRFTGINSARGQCGPCYHLTMREVKAGRTSWAEQEAIGRSKPPGKAVIPLFVFGRKP